MPPTESADADVSGDFDLEFRGLQDVKAIPQHNMTTDIKQKNGFILFSSESSFVYKRLILRHRQVFWLVILSPSRNKLFQWVLLKRSARNSIDFTAAGTAPDFHRIPYPEGKHRRRDKDNIYFDGRDFFMTFVPASKNDGKWKRKEKLRVCPSDRESRN